MRKSTILIIAALVLAAATAKADDVAEQKLSIKNHAFTPSQINVPAGQKVKLVITNDDPSPAEFESYELHREKVIAAHGSVTIFVGPLDAGHYSFVDDFHRDTTTGMLIVQ